MSKNGVNGVSHATHQAVESRGAGRGLAARRRAGEAGMRTHLWTA